MGADWYTFSSYTAAAIPVPKEALQKPFELEGFKLMTISSEAYDSETEEELVEYHGALICLPETQLCPNSVEVLGPYQITQHQAECLRLAHLDGCMTADARDRLLNAFEAYTGHKSEDVPGFWTVCASSNHYVGLQTTWYLGALGMIAKCPDLDRSGYDERSFVFTLNRET